MTPSSNPSPSMIGWLIVILVIGAACYVADRQVGTGLYRWWHDLTSKKPLGRDADIGFIYKRRARARFSIAVFLGVVHSMAAVWGFHVSPFTQLVTFVVEVPLLMGGFYLGPMLYGLWERKDPILDVVDDLEAGKTTVGDMLKKGGARARDLARERFGKDDALPEGDAAGSPPQAGKTPARLSVAPPRAVAPAPPPDPQEMMDRFTHPKKEPGHGGNSTA